MLLEDADGGGFGLLVQFVFRCASSTHGELLHVVKEKARVSPSYSHALSGRGCAAEGMFVTASVRDGRALSVRGFQTGRGRKNVREGIGPRRNC